MADVAFEVVNVDFVSKSELSFSKYKKVPILTVNGYQINDSAIIIKTLSPICYGRPLSEVEKVQIEETTTKAMLAFEIVMFQSDQNIQKYLTKFIKDEGCMGWIFKVLFLPHALPATHPSSALSTHPRTHPLLCAPPHSPRALRTLRARSSPSPAVRGALRDARHPGQDHRQAPGPPAP